MNSFNENGVLDMAKSPEKEPRKYYELSEIQVGEAWRYPDVPFKHLSAAVYMWMRRTGGKMRVERSSSGPIVYRIA